MVSVGIFWVIYHQLYAAKQEVDEKQVKDHKRTQLTGIMDSDYGHFDVWDQLCGKMYPRADFATYPRGRVVYDIKNAEHIIYVDECIIEKEIKGIATTFCAEKYRVEHDEHYACDKCLRKKGFFD